MTFWRPFRDNIDIVFFYSFLWSIPFGWRKVFVPSLGAEHQLFNEYLDFSLYVSECLLIVTIFISILRYININLSIDNEILSQQKMRAIINVVKMFHVEHLYLFFGGLFFLICLASSLYSENQLLSAQAVFHLFWLYLGILFFIKRIVPRGTISLREISVVLFFSALFQSIIALVQFFNQSSIGLLFLDESIVSQSTINVAKYHFFDSTIVRSYGTFLHPNILGAYLGFIIILFIAKYKMFHVEHLFWEKIGLFFIFFGLLSTGSKTSLLFVLTFLLYLRYFRKKIMFHVEQLFIFIAMAIILLFFWKNSDLMQSISTRLSQLDIFLASFQFSLLGTGPGTYVDRAISYFSHESWWNLEPVHNLYLLILSEVGVLGLSLVLISVYLILKNVPRGTILSVPFAYLLILGMFDHYLWDIYQGTILFFLAGCVLILCIDIYNKRLYSINKNR